MVLKLILLFVPEPEAFELGGVDVP